VRNLVGLDHVSAGVGPNNSDQIIYIADGVTTGGFGHVDCGHTEKDVLATLPAIRTGVKK
jgi:hypothetical protein